MNAPNDSMARNKLKNTIVCLMLNKWQSHQEGSIVFLVSLKYVPINKLFFDPPKILTLDSSVRRPFLTIATADYEVLKYRGLRVLD
jgi:hypothetical protein